MVSLSSIIWMLAIKCRYQYSGKYIFTQQSFEQLNPKCVAVVIDPIQSVRGKVVIDAFRLINPLLGVSGAHEPRQTTSVNGHLNKPSI